MLKAAEGFATVLIYSLGMKNTGSVTLSTYRRPLLQLECWKCNRIGRYYREGLIDRFGPDATLPDVLRLIAKCPKQGSASDPCQAVYVGIDRRS